MTDQPPHRSPRNRGTAAALVVAVVALALLVGADGPQRSTARPPPDALLIDPPHDCRAALGGGAARCDAGVDMRSIAVWRDGSRLTMIVHLSEAPALDSDVGWTLEFRTGATACGLTSLDTEGPTTFGLPETRVIGAGCTATLEGATATLGFEGAMDGPLSLTGETRYLTDFSLFEGSADDVVVEVE